MQVKKQQVEPYMEQLTGSKLRKEYDKAVHCHYFHLFPSVHHEVMGPDAIKLVFVFSCVCVFFFFLILSFKPVFSLSSFALIKRLFSSSSFSDFRVVLSAHLRLLILLPAILIPACNSSSPAFHTLHIDK